MDPRALVVVVGKTELRYHLRCLEDLLAMLKSHGDWMVPGSADEQKPAAEGTVEAWGRSSDNPVGGWYGLKKGLRGRFANYIPPVMEALKLAEVEKKPRNNRMRALWACIAFCLARQLGLRSLAYSDRTAMPTTGYKRY